MTRSARPWKIERGVLWAIELDVAPLRVEPRAAAHLREVNVREAAALAAAMQVNANEVRDRFVLGRRGYAAFVKDEIAAYGWVSCRPEYIGEQEREIKLNAAEAYIWDCATLPPFRNLRLYSALLSHINGVLYKERAQRAFIGSGSSNRPSLRGFATAGFIPVMGVTFFRMWNFRAMWLTALPNASRELVNHARRVWLDDDERVWGKLAWRIAGS